MYMYMQDGTIEPQVLQKGSDPRVVGHRQPSVYSYIHIISSYEDVVGTYVVYVI